MLPTTKPDSKTAHTPGPWQCSPYNKADSLYAVYDADGNELTYDDDEHEANARLIAAAPDLLAALRDAHGHLEHMAKFIADQKLGYSFENLGEDIGNIRDAIARAEGSAQ